MKETYYFSHDYHARHDIKLQFLTMEQLGIYWCLIEMLYEENGYIKLTLCERIANALRTQCDTLEALIHNFELFDLDKEKFWSNSVLRRLKEREDKSNKAKQSAHLGWAMRTHSERNAIKERKGKESKDIYILGLGITFWNHLAQWRGTIPNNKTVAKRLLPICRKETDILIKAWNKIAPKKEDWESAVNAYVVEIANRNPDNDYALHRFTMYEFVKQTNGYLKFLNR